MPMPIWQIEQVIQSRLLEIGPIKRMSANGFFAHTTEPILRKGLPNSECFVSSHSCVATRTKCHWYNLY